MELAGKNAVVTGASRGIGAAIARMLGRAGAKVIVTARTREAAEPVAKEVGGLAMALDVTDANGVRGFAKDATSAIGAIDILVNNAGIAGSAPIKRIELDDWNRILAVNLTGTMLCTQAFVGAMAERGWGRIVNVASITARSGAPYIAAYTASKHGVLGLTRVAAAEYAKKGVTVNAVCPGYVDTEMTTESVARVMKQTGLAEAPALEAILRTVNQPRLITPDEVAFAVVSLCRPEAGGINGQAVIVDGGGLLS